MQRARFWDFLIQWKDMDIYIIKKIFEAAGIDGESLKTYEEIDTAFSKLKTMIDNGDLKDEFPDLEAVMDFR